MMSGGVAPGKLLLGAVDDVDAGGGKQAGNDILDVEGLVQAQTGAHGSHHGDERVVDGHLANGIAGEQLVVERKADGADADEQAQPQQPQGRDCRHAAAQCQPHDHKQDAAQGQAVARAHRDVDPPAQAAREQRGCRTAQGIEHNHAIAQPREAAATATAGIEQEDAGKAHDATCQLAHRHAVGLEKQACHDDYRKHAERVEYSSSRARAVGKADVEKGIVQRGVDQAKQRDVPPIAPAHDAEGPASHAGHGQDNGAGHGEPDAGKEHLAPRHCGQDAKLGIAQLDERVGKAPGHGSRQGKHGHPHGALKNRLRFFSHWLNLFQSQLPHSGSRPQS